VALETTTKMSQPHARSGQSVVSEENTIEGVFEVEGKDPYETQRTVQRYLSQETRHNILQVIIGHPAHLVSVTEFAYYIPKSWSTISEQLGDLASHGIVKKYIYEANSDARDVPSAFWGLTAFGLALLEEYNYLRGLPIMRAAHDATHKPETVQRHEKAPRPDLPEAINEQLEFDDSGQETAPTPEDSIAELREQTFYADAAPADPSVLNEDADGDRTLDELFG
jgi:hypothetical protein